MTYKDRNTLIDQNREQWRKDLTALAVALAGILNGEVEEKEEQSFSDISENIVTPNYELWLRRGKYDGDPMQVAIHISTVKAENVLRQNGYLGRRGAYDTSTPEIPKAINLAAAKTPEQFAKAIQVKLIEPFLTALQQAREKYAGYVSHGDRVLTLAREVQAISGGRLVYQEPRQEDFKPDRTDAAMDLRVKDGYGDVTIHSDDSATMKLHSLPVEMVRKIAELLAAMPQK